jgi:hypothetical protein
MAFSIVGELLHTDNHLYQSESFHLNLKFLAPLFSIGLTTIVTLFKTNEIAKVVHGTWGLFPAVESYYQEEVF